MSKQFFRLAALTVLLCARAASADPAVLIQRDGIRITEDDLKYYIDERLTPQSYESGLARPGAIRFALGNLYIIKRGALAAREQQLIDPLKLDYIAAMAADRVALDAYVESNLTAGKLTKDWETLSREAYLADSTSYSGQQEVKASHILISARERSFAEVVERVRLIQERLEAGEAFEALAQEWSDDRSAKMNSGYLGFFKKGSMHPEFEKVAFSMTEIGQISDPVLTPFGVHVIRFEGKRQAEATPFETVRAQLIEKLQKQYAQSNKETTLEPFRAEIADQLDALDEEQLANTIYNALIAGP
jgi:peptidyl-prolyl cis-trans isomerase C